MDIFFNKKAITPVVATALLLVVAVAAVMGFQGWFQTYQSGVNSKVEIQSNTNLGNTKIETLAGNTLYFKNGGTRNISINSVKIGGIDCNISKNISTGMKSLNVTNCLNNLTTSTPDIVVFTSQGIYQEKTYIKNAEIPVQLTQTQTCINLSNNLVALWHMNESSSSIIDSSSNSYNGNATGGVNYSQPGKIGTSLGFDGINDRVELGQLNAIGDTETSQFTISAWINSNNVSISHSQVIISNYMGEAGGSGSFSYSLNIKTLGNLQFVINKRQIVDSRILVPITTGWHHVVGTYDGSNLSLYVDNILENSTLRTFSGSTTNIRETNIGDFSDHTNSVAGYRSSFDGYIDELSLWDRTLNSSEINEIYTQNNFGKPICNP